MKWTDAVCLRFEIELESGTRIGGGQESLEIGAAVDANLNIIRDPVTNEPYIPGSSLKGKLRSTLELIYGLSREGEPCKCGQANCPVCKIFGAHMKPDSECAPTRIIVRDAPLTSDSRARYHELLRGGKEPIETKTENIIDRKQGTARHPRTGERVAPGMRFDGQIILHIYEGDDDARMVGTIKQALKAVEEFSGIGASVSRGYGKVRFHNIQEQKTRLADFAR